MPCENGKKYIGDDLNTLFQILNAQKCQEKCQIDSACSYWTWELYNWDLKKHDVCWKKSSKNEVENVVKYYIITCHGSWLNSIFG